MAKKKYRINDTFGGGYTEYDPATGEKEHFIKHKGIISEGYYGNKGSERSVDRLTGTRTLKDKNSEAEVFHKGILTDDYYGSKGTHISKHTYGNGFSISKKGGKTEHISKKDDGKYYSVFYDEAKKSKKTTQKEKDRQQRELEEAYRDATRGPVFSLVIDILILLYAFLSLMIGAIPKHDIVNHILLIVGILQFSCVCGATAIDVSTYLLNLGYLFIPHFLLHLFGIVGARDNAFYTYHAIGPTFTIILSTYAVGIVLYILCRNNVFSFLKGKIFPNKKHK